MPNFRFDTTISLGSVLSIVTIIASAGMAYASMQSGIEQTREHIASMEKRMDVLEASHTQDIRDGNDNRVQLNGRLTGLETNMTTLLGAVNELRRHALGDKL